MGVETLFPAASSLGASLSYRVIRTPNGLGHRSWKRHPGAAHLSVDARGALGSTRSTGSCTGAQEVGGGGRWCEVVEAKHWEVGGGGRPSTGGGRWWEVEYWEVGGWEVVGGASTETLEGGGWSWQGPGKDISVPLPRCQISSWSS